MQQSQKKELLITADGSHTLYVPELNEHYHSVNGAVQESTHVFIHAGLDQVIQEPLRILEIGFGTGLNAFLSLLSEREITYYTVERYPLGKEFIRHLNYASEIAPQQQKLFESLHETAWDKEVGITDNFRIHKISGDSNTCDLPVDIDLIYFDAFAPEKQPEMWTSAIFEKLYLCMAPGGVITTYCAKGVVRRMMHSAGFTMERIPGPPGKREMLRGRKSTAECL